MSVKQEIRDKILTNLELRLKLALALKIGEEGVKAAAKRNSESLTKAAAMKVLKEELKLTEAEILDEEIANA